MACAALVRTAATRASLTFSPPQRGEGAEGGGGASIALGVILKTVLSLILLPFKLILLPVVALLVLVKVVVLVAVGVTLVSVFLAVLIPLVVVGGLIVAPIALIAAVS